MYICVDLDDTLLRSDKSISDFTLMVLRKCKQKKHKIIINTARNYDRTIDIFTEIGADYAVICAGSQIIDANKKVIYDKKIGKEIVANVVKELLLSSQSISIQTEESLLTNNLVTASYDVKVVPVSELCEQEAYKILVYKGDLHRIVEVCGENNLNYVNYLNGNWTRISPLSATKYLGLKRIIDYEKGSMTNVMSFGDDYGDLEMLTKSGIGIAMGNSISEVLNKVKVTCETNDVDGVANFLVKYFKLKI